MRGDTHKYAKQDCNDDLQWDEHNSEPMPVSRMRIFNLAVIHFIMLNDQSVDRLAV